MRDDNDDTRLTILRAAELLFAERGVDGVSLREVSEAADQRNHAAAQYHFGSKSGLLDAIIERHSLPIQAGWLLALDHMEATVRPTVRSLVQLLVRPIVGKLDDPDGGKQYLLLSAQLSTHPRYPLMQRRGALGPGALRLSRAISALVERPPALMAYRMNRTAATLYQSVAFFLSLHPSGGTSRDRGLFVEDLIDCLVAQTQARVAPHTRKLLDAKE